MKLITTFILILVVTFSSSCRKETKETFDLTRDEIIRSLELEGEVVDIVGDEGPYISVATFYGNYGNPEGSEWTEGVSRASHTLNYKIEENYYHTIHAYDNKAGGALLVGVRHSVDRSNGEQVGDADAE